MVLFWFLRVEALFGEIVQTAPHRALELAKCILAHDGTTPLARAWVVLITDNTEVSNRADFFRQAISSKCRGIRAASVRSVTRPPRNGRPLTSDEQTVLMEIAK